MDDEQWEADDFYDLPFQCFTRSGSMNLRWKESASYIYTIIFNSKSLKFCFNFNHKVSSGTQLYNFFYKKLSLSYESVVSK